MKPRYLLLVAGYCAGIWWLSSQTDPPDPGLSIPGLDKIAHLVLYAGLAGVTALGIRRSNPAASPLWVWCGPPAFAVLYGVVDEIHQSFVPLRSPSVGDLAADAAGALLLQVAVWYYLRRRAGGEAVARRI